MVDLYNAAPDIRGRQMEGRMTTTTETLPARALAAGEGEARWWFGQLAVIKATAKDTAGGHTLVEITVNPGYETPLHIHHREDEGFWMLDGSATFTVGNQTVEAGPGAYLFGPKHVPHKWKAGADGARLLYLFAPGGFEDLIREMSEPARELVPPPPEVRPPDNVVEVATRFGVELLL
jgi:quercetin dioxygenase-like cupin family protein